MIEQAISSSWGPHQTVSVRFCGRLESSGTSWLPPTHLRAAESERMANGPMLCQATEWPSDKDVPAEIQQSTQFRGNRIAKPWHFIEFWLSVSQGTSRYPVKIHSNSTGLLSISSDISDTEKMLKVGQICKYPKPSSPRGLRYIRCVLCIAAGPKMRQIDANRIIEFSLWVVILQYFSDRILASSWIIDIERRKPTLQFQIVKLW